MFCRIHQQKHAFRNNCRTMRLSMILQRTIIYLCLTLITISSANIFSFNRLRSYAKYLDWDTLGTNSSENELWNGIIHDCSRKMTFSCIQKNAYIYLDNTFIERDNITVFEGVVLRKNDLDYETLSQRSEDDNDVAENLVDASVDQNQGKFTVGDDNGPEARITNEEKMNAEENYYEENKTPLEEITSALRDKTIKFLATRDYELQLPDFFFERSTIKISPRKIDDNGALIRVDFGQRGLESEGRLFFKKIRKFIQNKLLMSFLALLLIIKLIKVKFMFVIPFLFGIGTAKKLFLKLLLFLVPAFKHVFTLCSSYYSHNANRFHHHHHQIAHHHHHVPVPVPVPAYLPSGHHHHHPHHEEEYEGYAYPHPHVQLRRDMDELKEWGIEQNEPYDNIDLHPVPDHAPLSPVYQPNTYGLPQNVAASRSPGILPYQEKYPTTIASHAHSLAYNGYIDEHPKYNRRKSIQPTIAAPIVAQISQASSGPINIQVPATSSVNAVTLNVPSPAINSNGKMPYNIYPQQQKPSVSPQDNAQWISKPIQQAQTQRILPSNQLSSQSSPSASSSTAQHSSNQVVTYDDAFYGPILERLEDIFAQLRFVEENCRERLVCSMYKKPALYSPHSNIVSNELSRDPQELKRGVTGSNSSQRFHRYVNAARLGQDDGDCHRAYPCQIKTE